ncbi:hypothetical protein G9F71_008980 [Clostridium sp. FP2]|uniref:hypothetical protein n=1 Tax=Clostridium sp. FP2 TaxID=2724481 RepID=UPI0013E90CB2|nr:hypothetical protein [Clostridium sp. FP2]MBZ9622988.1 hypothetical protein [Clostridium sp. FP2]
MKIQIKNELKVIDYNSIEIKIDTWEEDETWYCIKGTTNSKTKDIIRFKDIKMCKKEYQNIVECNGVYILDPNKEGTIPTTRMHNAKFSSFIF